MPYIPLDIPPGVVRNGTQYQVGVSGRWYDANLVRWQNGVMRPVGGWEKTDSTGTFTGFSRDLYAWRDNTSAGRYLAIGSNEGLWVLKDGELTNITATSFNPGRPNAIFGFGFGFGAYGNLAYGTARPSESGNVLPAAGWSFDNWGEYLVAVAPHNGKIVEWALDPATPAQEVANAPFDNRGIIVTPERHLVALGAGGDAKRVAWSDREDNTTWAAAATNLAGDLPLQTNGEIQTATKVRGQVLILTSSDVHLMSFVGPPFVYGIDRISSSGGTSSPRALVGFEGGAAWMSETGFFIFDGTVRSLPCDVEDYVLGDLNAKQFSKVVGGENKEFKEVWWLYPSEGSLEVDRYVLWNYRENHWSIGRLERTAFASPGVFSKPLLAGLDGLVYEHENGFKANGAPIQGDRYAESGAADIGNGDRTMIATQLVPDERTQGDTRATFKVRFTPNGPETSFGPFTLTDYTDVRFTGRQVALRVEGTSDTDWRVGIPRLNAREGGLR